MLAPFRSKTQNESSRSPEQSTAETRKLKKRRYEKIDKNGSGFSVIVNLVEKSVDNKRC